MNVPRRWFLPGLALQSVVVTLALTWPTVARIPTWVLGSPDADTMKHLWTLWWMRAMVYGRGALPLETDLLNYPDGLRLWPIEPLNGLILMALPFSVVTASNILGLLNHSITGIFGGLLGREVSGSRLGAHLAGLTLQGSSFALFTLHVGIGELTHLWILPLGMLCLLRLERTGGWGWVLGTAMVLGFGTIACFYHGLFLSLGLLVLGLAAVVRGPGRAAILSKLLVAAVLATGVVIPVTRAFSSAYGPGSPPPVGFTEYVFVEGHGQPVTDPVSARLEPAQLVLGRADQRDQGPRELHAYGGGRLLAWPALLLGVLALARRPGRALPWLVVSGLGVLLALGSYLSSGGQEVLAGGQRLMMPFLFLNRALGYMAEPLNFPVRFLALATTALAALAALAVAPPRPGRWGRWVPVLGASLAVGAVVDVQCRQLLPRPLGGFTLPDMTPLRTLSEGERGAVLDLSASWRDDREARFFALVAQLHHERPVQAVPIERLEFHAREGRRFAGALSLVEDLGPLYQSRLPPLDGDYGDDLALLRAEGFTDAIVFSMGYRDPLPQGLVSTLERIMGPPVVTTGDGRLAVYRIPDVEVDEGRLEALREAHRDRMEALAATERQPGAPG